MPPLESRKVITFNTHRSTPHVMQALFANVVAASKQKQLRHDSPQHCRGELNMYEGHRETFPQLAQYFNRLLESQVFDLNIANIGAVEYTIYDSHISVVLECYPNDGNGKQFFVLNFPTKNFSADAL